MILPSQVLPRTTYSKRQAISCKLIILCSYFKVCYNVTNLICSSLQSGEYLVGNQIMHRTVLLMDGTI